MRTRLISLLTAGALVISSLIIGGSIAQADDDTTAILSGTLSLPAGYTLSRGTVFAGEVVQTDDGLSLNSSVTAYTSSDGKYRFEVKSGATYIVYATSYQSLSQGNNADLLPAVAGGYQTQVSGYYGIPGGIDWSDPSIDKITMTSDKTVDLAMTAGAKITGTVYAPDGTPVDHGVNVRCIPVSSYLSGQQSYGTWTNTDRDSDGSYSCTVVPGTYVVTTDDAVAYSTTVSRYPATWVGGFVGSKPTLPDANVTQITASGAGQTTSGQDIHLSAGSSVSGRLIGFVPDPDVYVEVDACMRYADGSRGDCMYTSTIDDNGNYTVTGVVPGAATVVNAAGNGYVTAWYGGHLGGYVLTQSFSDPGITSFTSAAVGGTVPNIDITLTKPVTITGSIIPASVVTDSDRTLYVFGCPVYTQDGQNYYRTSGAIGGGGFMTANDHSYIDDEHNCAWNPVASDASYALQVLPGLDYVVIAQAEGYTDAWYGGYVADSGVVNDVGSPDRVLPATSKIQIMSGTAGQLIDGKDIVFGESHTWTVTFVDGQGTTLATRTSIDGGSVTTPVDPTKDGYTFGGWYTQKDGAGTQFTGDTVVTADVTVYAWWRQHVSVSWTNNCPTTQDVIMGSAFVGDVIVLPSASQQITCEGYRFVSYNTKDDGSGTVLAPGSSLTITGDTTLVAWFEPAPEAEVVKEIATVESTGGLARLADGTDAYTLITTLTDGDGHPMPGLAGNLSAVTPANVTASGFTDNGGGRYSVQVSASVPGNYLITVLLDGVEVPGSPIPVNFIGASIEEPVRMVGDTQSAEGLGFLPGEQVDVTVHSDPINIGRRTADAQGRVPVSFDVPKGFDLGRHTVEFVGVTSGTATVSFSVATPTADSSQIQAQSGGTVQGHGSLLFLAVGLVLAGLAVQRVRKFL